MKKIISSISIVLGIICFTGCGVNLYKENIEKMYKDYWTYSLGDYKVSYKIDDDKGSNGSGGLTTNKWYNYTFSFRDINNDLRDITISNFNIKDFNDKISDAAALFLKKDIEKDMIIF